MPSDIRDVFFEEIHKIAKEDPKVVFLTDDMDAFGLKKFEQDFPGRFVNVGVAEQNMVNLAAGLTLAGKKVFAYGIASFVTFRCLEQIKVNLCSMNLPVTLIGVGTGFSFGFDGPTHHGIQDLSVMRTLPEMTIYDPSDLLSASACARLAYQGKGPSYIRLDKGEFPTLGDSGHDFKQGFRILRPLQKVNLIAGGFMTQRALCAADELQNKSVNVGVVDLYRPKPLNKTFFSAVVEPSEEIITLEENALTGGLGTILSEMIADRNSKTRLRRLAVPDPQFISYGSRQWFHETNVLNPQGIARKILAGST